NELRESLQQRTATADVLRVISSSPGELEPVFEAMLANAVRICEAKFGVLFRFEDGAWRAAAMSGVPPAFAEFWQHGPQRAGPRTALGRVAATKQTVQVADATTDPAYVEGEPVFVAVVKLGGFRTLVAVPMLKEKEDRLNFRRTRRLRQPTIASQSRFMSTRPSVMGPGDVKSPRVIVTPPSSRFCPWSAPRPPHYAVRRNGEPI